MSVIQIFSNRIYAVKINVRTTPRKGEVDPFHYHIHLHDEKILLRSWYLRNWSRNYVQSFYAEVSSVYSQQLENGAYLSQVKFIRRLHIPTFKIHFNIIFYSYLDRPSSSFLSKFTTDTQCAYLISHSTNFVFFGSITLMTFEAKCLLGCDVT